MAGDKFLDSSDASDTMIYSENSSKSESSKEGCEPEAMEVLMQKLDNFGRYQLFQIVIVCMSCALSVFVMLNFVFIGK